MPLHVSRPSAGGARRWLLAGVSLGALAGAGAPAAEARQPPLFSPQWFAARSQAGHAAASGGATTTGTGTASAAAAQTVAQAQAAQSIVDLTRMAAAIKAAQAAQSAAVAAGPGRLAATVTDGLTPGGLQPAPGAMPLSTLWIGANAPVQASEPKSNRVQVTVQQTQPKALLTWSDFNVGSNTDLVFDQSGGGSLAANWVVLNQVRDPYSAPSRIFGSITAPGKVYIINGNGVLFGAGAQVNVNALIASAASLQPSITTGSVQTGSTVDFTIYGAVSGSGFAPSFVGAAPTSTVEVQAGAQISTASPASATSGGGYVMLLGGTARNAGSIVTPDGQTVLASGQNFVLRPGFSTTGNQTATTVGSQVATVGLAGSTENDGIISATDGDVTLVGHDIIQAGLALASTSVSERGTVHLLSDTRDGVASIILAPGSVTAVLPDASEATALNSQRSQLIAESASLNALRLAPASDSNPQLNNVGTLADRLDLSRVEITTGGAVAFGAGSLTLAPGGQVAVQAAQRVLADSSAVIDVAGQLKVTLPMSANDLVISVESDEQRDAPVNRLAGSLDSSNVTIDARGLVLVPASTLYPTDRYYTPGGLLEVSGYLDTTGHTIGEWTALGGTITLAAAQVVAQPNAVFNISGGSVAYQGGTLNTSYLVGADGHLYNADTAPANILYTSVYRGFVSDHPRWNVTNAYASPLFAPPDVYQPGYVVGRDAGALTISAPSVVFEGTLIAGVVDGPNQTAPRPAGVTDGYALGQTVVPLAGTLSFGQYSATGLIGTFPTSVVLGDPLPALAGSISPISALPNARVDTAYLSAAAINAAGLGGLTLTTSGSIRVLDAVTLATGGSASLVGATVDIGGGITARGGQVLASNVLALGAGTVPTALAATGKGAVILRPGATIDARGVWTNAPSDATDVAGEGFVNGGSVTLDSAATLTLAAGSRIDVSAGAALLANGRSLGGEGGSVSLIGDDPTLPGQASALVTLAGTLTGFGVTGSGTLRIVAPAVAIADARPLLPPTTVWLDPGRFQQGFATYDVTGVSGVSIAAATTLAPEAPVFRLTDASGSVPTGGDPATALQLWLPPVYIEDPKNAKLTERQGVSLLLRADADLGSSTAHGGTVTLGSGASISVDPGQTVRLEGYDQVTVLGTITAPGGTIAVVNTREENVNSGLPPGFTDGLSVWLGSQSRLDVAGRAYTALDSAGQTYGVVLAGGRITLGADGGTQSDGTQLATDALVILRPGATVDASGAMAVLDPVAGTAGNLAQALVGATGPTAVASNGGSIALSSYDGIYLDGTVRAAAGGAGASGGTLALTLEAPLYAPAPATPPTEAERLPRRILISQATTSDLDAAALRPGQATPVAVRDEARISVAQITAGGFANLSLFARDVIAFDGNVALALPGSVTFQQGIIATTQSTAHASVSAPYVLLSGYTSVGGDAAIEVTGISANGTNWLPSTAATTARFTVNANLIDIANDLRFGVQTTIAAGGTLGGAAPVSLAVAYPGFADIALNSAGDIRFGTTTLVTPGNITFSGAQLYPTTLANAEVFAGVQYAAGTTDNVYAAGHAVTIAWNGVSAAAPYSVGGSLLFAAPTIEQGGVLRAPEGQITLGAVDTVPAGAPTSDNTFTSVVKLGASSVTSVSAAGQTIPFGGTTDNINYDYDGSAVTPFSPTIELAGQAILVRPQATLDISGGGTLTGAGFQSGRGGSVDPLLAPLLNISAYGSAQPTLKTDPVYAIMPGYASGYAPVTPLDQSAGYGGSVPATGAQISLTASAPGLPAGTYTLLPAYYALLPGAWLVELNTTTHTVLAGTNALPTGSYVVGGYQGIANQSAAAALPVPVTLTPGSVVRTYGTYNETDYTAFQLATALRTGAPRAAIPADAKALTLLYPATPATYVIPGGLPALSYAGVSDFAPAAGGFGSVVSVEGLNGASTAPAFEITRAGVTPTAGFVSIAASDLDALGAARLIIGGSAALATVGGTPTLSFTGTAQSVVLRGGATLTAPEVFLVASSAGGVSGAVTVQTGATIDSIGSGAPPYDSSNGYFYNSFGYTLLAVSNGSIDFTPITAANQFYGAITIADGATLYSAGTLSFSTTQGLNIGATASFGARYVTLDLAEVDLLSDAMQASLSAQPAHGPIRVPQGLQLGEATFNRLLGGNPAAGVPAVVDLTLTATQSVNLFGSVALSTANSSAVQQFVINTPAIYGWGDTAGNSSSDAATITAGSGTLVWNGIAAAGPLNSVVSQLPGGFASTGLASGGGTLRISAQQIVLGYPADSQVQTQVALDRTVVGFATVDLAATQAIVVNANGALSVYATPGARYGLPGSGGTLALSTPLLTGAAGALATLSAGGALTLVAPAGGTLTAGATGLGAEIDLAAPTVSLASAVVLPSGRFVVTAQAGIAIGAGASLDLAGAAPGFFDQTIDTPGGTAILQTASGDLTAAVGSTIDVAASNAAAGSLTADALGGTVTLAGTILGGAASAETAGSITVAAATISNFAGLNSALTQGGVTGLRSFRIGRGNLTVGNEIVANSVSLSIDSGSLTVTGTIAASGATPGTISLAAETGLTLASTALLDAHATMLHTDSNGAAIDAENTPQITLTTQQGTLALQAGATLDLRSADTVARGQVVLNAPRLGSNDIAIEAAGPLAIRGVSGGSGLASVALYGWHDYNRRPDPKTGVALITQAYLDQINSELTVPFMTAADANPQLAAQVAGLRAAAGANFHLRPGVAIDIRATPLGTAVEGDLDLATFRYGPNGNEPGALLIRSRGNLSVNGSITDGFAAPVDSKTAPNPDDNGWVLFSGAEPFGADVVLPVALPAAVTLGAGTTFPTSNAVSLNYAIRIAEATLNQGVVIPVAVTLAPAGDTNLSPYVIPTGGWVTTAAISEPERDAHGHLLLNKQHQPIYRVVYRAGTDLPAGTKLETDWVVGAGSVLPFQVNAVNGQLWPAGDSLQVFSSNSVTLTSNVTLPGGAFIPSGSNVAFADGSAQENLRRVYAAGQGQIWAAAPMLPAGSLSWSIALVSGADATAADPLTVRPSFGLNGNGNLVLSDLHYVAPEQGSSGVTPAFSVIRTGTGTLTLRAAGDITEYSQYGIYTAGTQSAAVAPAYELPQAGAGDGTVLGAAYSDSYNQYVTAYQAYYPSGGGNVLVAAQGGVYGDISYPGTGTVAASDWVGNWLWRQGDGAGQATAWWINFGTYVLPLGNGGGSLASQPALEGFVGIGTLGGGNLTVIAGGNAGVTTGRDPTQTSDGLVLAVATTGRVGGVTSVGGAVTGGTVLETGGGDLTLRVGGALNGLNDQPSYDGLNGSLIDLRGKVAVTAGAVGGVVLQYGTSDPVDPRPLDPNTATVASEFGGPIVVPGDATVTITALRDLVLGGAGDAGRLPTQDLPGFTYTASGGATALASGGITAFSLWTPATAVNLVSLGGNLTPTTQPTFGSLSSGVSNDMQTDSRFLYPPTLAAVAASGSIYYGTTQTVGTSMTYSLELAPAPSGQIALLAAGSIYAAGYSLDISGAPATANDLANPFRPEYNASGLVNGTAVSVSNSYAGAAGPYALFAFGADTPTGDLHADDPQPARFYAVAGDIVDLRFGEILNFNIGSGITPATWYVAAKPAWIEAGRDIVAAGTRPADDPSVVGDAVFAQEQNQGATAVSGAATSGNLILNLGSNDISLVQAGRDILQSYFYIAGPGLLSVEAGRNLNQQNEGILKSLGPVFDVNAANRDVGAGISVIVGAGATGLATEAFADLYFNPANAADPAFALTAPQNQGKVAQTYAPELLAWLQQNAGYTGTADGALTYFLALPSEQQEVFVRQVFFAELLAGGREETDPTSRRYHSYVRGKEAIATLFPGLAALGTTSAASGSLTMYSGTLQSAGSTITDATTGQPVVFDAGISTQFGGNIQLLAPTGQVLLGTSGGVQPGSNTGLITFGSGNIEGYALGSVLLGQSRIFTTFGGSIQLWSAAGDINAGVGTKTSVIYQPPSISYDEVGSLTLAPTAPTNGAGIATLTSVPGVPAGDVDLVAPQGTIDAGEAGIRVSGNLTLAALVVNNANNLQVGGKTVGAPTVATSNVGALSAAAATTGAAESTASGTAEEQRRKRQAAESAVIVVEVVGYGE